MNENSISNEYTLETGAEIGASAGDLQIFKSENDLIPERLNISYFFARYSKWLIAGFICGCAFLMGVFVTWMAGSLRPSTSSLSTNMQTDEMPQKGFSDTITVDVHGDVAHPGVYHLSTDARVMDAVSAAGGYVHHQDSQYINEAEPLTDGQEVVVSDVTENVGRSRADSGRTSSSPAQPSSQNEPNSRIDLNTADASTLETISGIGQKRAQEIIAYREAHGPFKSVADLHHIRGFGKATISKILSYVFVS